MWIELSEVILMENDFATQLLISLLVKSPKQKLTVLLTDLLRQTLLEIKKQHYIFECILRMYFFL